MKSNSPKKTDLTQGFTLVEVIIALGLFVFAITAIMGVLPFGMSQVQTAANEGRGMALLEDMRDDAGLALKMKSQKSVRHQIEIPSQGSTTAVDSKISYDGEASPGGPGGSALFRVVGSITRPAANSPEPTHIHLRATWPAAAPPGRESGSVELVSAFEP